VEGNDLRAAECLTRRVPTDPIQANRLHVVAAATELCRDPRRNRGRGERTQDTTPTESVIVQDHIRTGGQQVETRC
jgi:hypothetical protein